TGTEQVSSLPYVVSHQFNSCKLNLVVTATVSYSNGDPDSTATTTINVIGLTISGNASPQRGWPATYTIQSNPTGVALSGITVTYTSGLFTTTYQDANSDGDDKTTWSGAMVASGTFSATATAMGVAPSAPSKDVNIAARTW